MKKYLLLFGLTILVSCATTKFIPPTPSQADADRGAKKIPGLTMEQLTAGKTNFEQQCGKCHGLKNPASRNEAQWRQTVPKMSAKAKNKFKKDVIDAAMQESILAYLVTMGKQ
jgi:cytochrome c5